MKTKRFNQRIRVAFVWLVLVGLFASCDKIKDLVATDITVTPSPMVFTVKRKVLPNVIVRSTSGADEELYSTTLDTRLNYNLEKEGFSFDNVRDFSLMKAEVKSKNPVGYDLSGFVGMKLYLGSAKDLVAEATSVSSDKKTLTLDIGVKDIKKYVQSDNLLVLVKGPNPLVEQDVQLSMQLEFKARVSPL